MRARVGAFKEEVSETMARWSNWRWSLLTLALVVALAAILGGAAMTRSRRDPPWLPISATTPSIPDPKPRLDPGPEFVGRPLRFEPLPAAQDLYRKVAADPYSATLRHRLADVYRNPGYGAVGDFFLTPPEFLDGHRIRHVVGPKEPPIKWLA